MPDEQDGAEHLPSSSQDRSLLTHRRLLGGRLYLHTWVRLVLAVVIGLAALIDRHIGLFDPSALAELAWLAVAIAIYNSGPWILFRRYRAPELSAAANRVLQNTAYGTIVLDYLALTVFVWLSGGTRSPFIPFYLVHLVVSHLLLSRRRAISSVILAFAMLVALVGGELTQLFPTYQPFGDLHAPLDRSLGHSLVIVAVYGTLFGITSLVLVDLTVKLREREIRLHWAHAEANRLSTMRRDFLRIAMHNLRSPVGAVTMLLKNLQSGLGGPVTAKQDEWIERSLTRLEGLSAFLHDLQMLAVLDNQALRAQREDVDMRPLLESLVEEHQDLAEEKGVDLTLELPPLLSSICGIERLLREAVVNYITNAIKYTPRGGHIRVRAFQHDGMLRVAVEDDGIGISAEDQARVFDEFARAGHQDPKTGSGLGLSIVKRVAEVHGGSARVKSAVGAGSTFTIELPLPETDVVRVAPLNPASPAAP